MNSILLTFDVEEFDIPLEYGREIDFQQQIEVSTAGLLQVLTLLEKHKVKCTFFTTATYAQARPDLIKRIAETHEIASHGYAHSSFENSDLKKSRESLELLLHQPVYGYRMARLAEVDNTEIEKAGYRYNSSMNPTWIPGRYNHLTKPRTPFFTGNVVNVPTSVTPILRIPLFWLSFKNFPMWMMKKMMVRTLKQDGFLSLYFHPWEFVDLSPYGLPAYIQRHSGAAMLARLDETLTLLKTKGEFITMNEFVGKMD